MKVSVLMIDGSFRENTYGAKYFTKQNFPEGEFEVIWVEYYDRAKEELYLNDQLKVITLNYPRESMYHSSFCFNKGITEAKGDILIIPDADVIVEPDFIQKVWNIHQEFEKLVVYGYRYNEIAEDKLNSLDINELKQKCLITNPTNYGGCLTVRKKWMLEINGYDQHHTFESGFHSNGLDIFTRFRNFGMAIRWDHSLKLYHPMHAFTAERAPEYAEQRKLIQWRSKKLDYRPLNGIDSDLNTKNQFPDQLITDKEKKNEKEKEEKENTGNNFLKKLKRRVFK
ncbi:MAG: glycosyltransferase [Saprospiraceae bacterium]|nr:glycosyltransferase [Saprospiraceae bacterium]